MTYHPSTLAMLADSRRDDLLGEARNARLARSIRRSRAGSGRGRPQARLATAMAAVLAVIADVAR